MGAVVKLKQLSQLLSIAMLYSGLSTAAAAFEQGEVRLTNGTQTREIELTDSDIIDNRPGAEVMRTWSVSERYPGQVYCEQGSIPARKSIFFQTTSALPSSDINPGFMKINDFIDVKVEIIVAGYNQNYYAVPFFDVDNLDRDYYCQSSPQNIHNPFESASKGRVTFKLRKSITNGAVIDDLETFDMFGRMDGGNGRYGSEPMFKVKIKTAIIGVPEKCIFNGGNPIEVDFGDMGNEGLDGSRYIQDLPIQFVCSGGDFDNGSRNIRLTIKGIASDFSSDYFKTDKQDLGIRLTSSTGTVRPNITYPVQSNQNSGSWPLRAAPLAKTGASISDGEFNASATVIASFD